MGEESKIKDVAESVKGVVEAVPIYQDVLQPAAREMGTALQTIAKTIHIALTPISALVWGYDKIKDFVLTRVAEKLKNVPPEQIKTPSPHVAGPALEALRFTGYQETLRELYANLLATSLDSNTAMYAHPSFVDIIKNMSPDEAKIIRLFATRHEFPAIDVQACIKEKMEVYSNVVRNYSFVGKEAGCEHQHLTPSYLDNLARLGLINIEEWKSLTAPNTYEPLENDPELSSFKEHIEKMNNRVVHFSRKVILLTKLGEQFCQACVIEK